MSRHNKPQPNLNTIWCSACPFSPLARLMTPRTRRRRSRWSASMWTCLSFQSICYERAPDSLNLQIRWPLSTTTLLNTRQCSTQARCCCWASLTRPTRRLPSWDWPWLPTLARRRRSSWSRATSAASKLPSTPSSSKYFRGLSRKSSSSRKCYKAWWSSWACCRWTT